MKLLTLNTHSLQEENTPQKLEQFVQGVRDLRPDLIALQEVNQLRAAPPADVPEQARICGGLLRQGNYAAEVVRRLRAAGLPCAWAWLPVKVGYGRYDEGLAVLSLSRPIEETRVVQVSARDDYDDWRTRKALAVRLAGRPDWFCSVHMGWWGDEDPFPRQWARLEAGLPDKRSGPIWLLGDFNAPAHVRGESYDLMQSAGWQDTYQLAGEKDSGITVEGAIDGWRDRLPGELPAGMRIDYIWCSQSPGVVRSQVVFNGGALPVVSDHYGVLAETEGQA